LNPLCEGMGNAVSLFFLNQVPLFYILFIFNFPRINLQKLANNKLTSIGREGGDDMAKVLKSYLWIIFSSLLGILAAKIINPVSGSLKIGVILGGTFVGWLFQRFGLALVAGIIKKFTSQELIIKGLGFLFGLLTATLLAVIIRPFIEIMPLGKSVFLVFLLVFFFTSVCLIVVSVKFKELSILMFQATGQSTPKNVGKSQLKILDTSSIIDGRLADLCKTGFLEGILIIPNFVVSELQRIADSADPLRRNRGRRGLDLLNKIRKENLVAVKIFDRDYDEITEVDTKLLRLAREIEAKVVTNDYNLNKVAELYGVQVLNINELSNAIKPVVLPGEEMVVHVLRDGKEFGQGIGYLDDGTMIVVEGGRNYIGLDIEILVTSVLQTSAGRMIFAKPKEYLMAKVT
jgi:uncharacterized protein YacL